MKLYEEFNEYATMWDLKEGREPSEYEKLLRDKDGWKKFDALPKEERDRILKAHQEHKAQDPINIALAKIGKIDLAYDSFDRDRCEDGFDPRTMYGHTQKTWTDHYLDFTYSLDAGDVYEVIYDIIYENKDKDSVKSSELVTKFNELDQKLAQASGEEWNDLDDQMNLFLAENLEAFVDLFINEVLEHFQEDAENWAEEHEEPYDPRWDY